MKRLWYILLIILIAPITFVGCKRNKSQTCLIIVNGNKTNINDYSIIEGDIHLPTQKILFALGAKYAYSPYNQNDSVCIELSEKKLVIDYARKLFTTEDKMDKLIDVSKEHKEEFNLVDQKLYQLLPIDAKVRDRYISWQAAELYLDSKTLIETLAKIGIIINIRLDDEHKSIVINQVVNN